MSMQASSTEVRRLCEQAALRAFHQAAQRVSAYQRILGQRGVRADSVTTIEDFSRRVPLVNKRALFVDHELADLCLDGQLGDATGAYTSSGYSGDFSFGLESARDAERLRGRIDQMLGFFFHADKHRTLLINGLPMGVRVPASVALTIDTGLRSDAILAAARKLGPACEQIIIIAEHPFLKKVLEEGEAAGIGWPNRRVHLITGAEVMPEAFRTYAGGILGHDTAHPERGDVMVSLGISEVGLSLGQETPFCRRVRRLAHRDEQFRRQMFGESPFLPTFVQWSPMDYFIETPMAEDGKPRLVVTSLDPGRRIPLIRYATGDWAQVMTANEVMEHVGLRGEVGKSELPSPFLCMWGRGQSLTVATAKVFPEHVKEAIYSDPGVAAATTASFRMRTHGARLHVDLQMKPNAGGSFVVVQGLAAAIHLTAGVEAAVTCVPYEQWPRLELSYQRKFQYM